MMANKDHTFPVERMLWRAVSRKKAEGIQRNGLLKILNAKRGKIDLKLIQGRLLGLNVNVRIA